jgi:hypothetical protein
MICETCKEKPGFVRITRALLVPSWFVGGGVAAACYEPCPDCGGCGISHCCDGLQEQPERTTDGHA